MELFNSSNLSETNAIVDGQVTSGYIAVAVSHIILVILPCLTLGPILLIILSNKKLRDPVSAIFSCITVICMTGPSTYGLLMDISLITNKPVLGTCDDPSGALFWFFLGMFHSMLVVTTALLSITQFAVIKFGVSRSALTYARIFVILAVLLIVILVISFFVITAPVVSPTMKRRGSLCTHSQGLGKLIVSAVGVMYLGVVMLPSLLLVIIFSILSYRTLKKGLTQNPSVIQSVVLVSILMIVVTVLFRMPQILLFFTRHARTGSDDYVTLLNFTAVYSSEVNYPLYIMLPIFLHKIIRKTFLHLMKSCCLAICTKKPMRVTPADGVMMT